jgi:hypothetical protein
VIVMERTPLILGLALASLGRLAARTVPPPPGLPQEGRAVSVVPDNGALLVDTERGPVLLIVAWDATLAGPAGAIVLADIRVGDIVRWKSNEGQSVVMVDHLDVVPASGR